MPPLSEQDVIRLVQGLSPAELRMCLKAGWVLPDAEGYLEIDVARIRLIHELRGDLGLDDEAVPVVLSLIDQLHALRLELHCLADSVRAQPDEIRARVLADVAARLGRPS